MHKTGLPIREEDVVFPKGREQIPGFLAYPAEGSLPRSGVLIIQEVWGLDTHIRDVARRVAGEGFVALAPDLFSREGPPPGDTIEALRPFMFAIPDLRVVADLSAAMNFLRSGTLVINEPIGAVGFCVGGTWARMLAAEKVGLAACVDFYGRFRYPNISESKPFQPIDRVAEMRCPYLGLFGGDDPVVPQADIDEVRTKLRAAKVDFDIKVYPGAPHAFFNDTRQLYRNPPAEAAFAETIDFLKQHLGCPR